MVVAVMLTWDMGFGTNLCGTVVRKHYLVFVVLEWIDVVVVVVVSDRWSRWPRLGGEIGKHRPFGEVCPVLVSFGALVKIFLWCVEWIVLEVIVLWDMDEVVGHVG